MVVVRETQHAKAASLTPPIDLARTEAGVVFLGERPRRRSPVPGIRPLRPHVPPRGLSACRYGGGGVWTPVVASDIRGCRQVVDHEHTGLLVRVRDSVALADAIGTLAADPIRRQAMGLAARVRAEQEFDERRVIARTLDTYRQLPVASVPPDADVVLQRVDQPG